jgi:hypothetical protein
MMNDDVEHHHLQQQPCCWEMKRLTILLTTRTEIRATV